MRNWSSVLSACRFSIAVFILFFFRAISAQTSVNGVDGVWKKSIANEKFGFSYRYEYKGKLPATSTGKEDINVTLEDQREAIARGVWGHQNPLSLRNGKTQYGYDFVLPGVGLGASGAMFRADYCRKFATSLLTDEQNLMFDSLLTPFERSLGKATASYDECVAWYQHVAKMFPGWVSLGSIGTGDIGKPIYVLRIDLDRTRIVDRLGNSLGLIEDAENQKRRQVVQTNTGEEIARKQVVRLLVNNNIHPGEPEGTDASMLLVRDMLFFPQKYAPVGADLQIHVVCQYNVDGTLNRGRMSRANQNGPEEYGFRGNAQNLDLNRDFVKMDSKNAQALVAYMSLHDFDFFIDNHTSNGADYQYVLTYFHTRPEKFYHTRKSWINPIENALALRLKQQLWITSPYVETVSSTPDSGIHAFWETGRYATGFAALQGCLGYTVETHMWKPFEQRVVGTLAFMEQFVHTVMEFHYPNDDHFTIHESGRVVPNSATRLKPGDSIALHFELDKTRWDSMEFYGYEAKTKLSEVTGMPRMYYDLGSPWKKKIKYYHYFKPIHEVVVPKVYIVPFAYSEVAKRLKWNGVNYKQLPMDTVVNVRVSYVVHYETNKSPYEKHYLHSRVFTRDTVIAMHLYKGDYVIPVGKQAAFLTQVLEPTAPDSYFAWNFFDGVLQQKEWFSDYIFEDYAAVWLKQHPGKKLELERKKQLDPVFAKDAWAQLVWVYMQTPMYEPTHNLIPVYRID